MMAGALINEISALLRRGQRASSLFSPCEDTRRVSTLQPRRGLIPDRDHAGTMVPVPASRTVRNEFLLLISHLVYSILL